MRIIIFLICTTTIFLAGCTDADSKKYDYSKLTMIAEGHKEVFSEMKGIVSNSNSRKIFEERKHQLYNQLESIQEEIDILPPVEREAKKWNAQKFNENHYNVREIYNKLQDIQYLLSDAANASDYAYFEQTVEDPALEARINNLIERCKNNGLLIPLEKQFRDLPVTDAGDNSSIEIESSIFKQ